MKSPPTSPSTDDGHCSTEQANGPVVIRHEPGSGGSVSTTVAVAVAAARDEDPTSMPPLHDVVDPDALDALCASTRDGTVSFTVRDCRVTIEDGTEITVRPASR